MVFRHFPRGMIALSAAAVLAAGGIAYAQLEGSQRGVAAQDSGGSFEVGGIDVDVTGKTADQARLAGWREAQRRGWQMLSERMGRGGGGLSDGALDGIVSGIVVENEELGPRRYVARLGVLFDRGRAAAILGVGGSITRSPPMLVIPVQYAGGTATTFERRTPWQEAWARYRTGNSAIDYVRPSGTGPDPLILNLGQTGRPARHWWRVLLDQYGASDILIPQVQLYRQWPGGPVIGVFTARYGPDNRMLRRFVLRVGNAAALGALLDAGVKRLDDTYQLALRRGILKVDPSLLAPPEPVEEEEQAVEEPLDAGLMSAVGTAVSLQFDTPDAGAVAATEAAVRGVPGVRAAATTSLALGGVSVMRVLIDGDAAGLRAGLSARGWQVEEAGGTLRIRRSAAPTTPPPAAPAPRPSG